MNYAEQLAQLKAERNEARYRELSADVLHHDQQRNEAEQAAQDALARGDSDSARWCIENAEHHEKSIADLSGELDQLDQVYGGHQQPALSEAKQAWIARRQDLAAQPGMSEVANYAHNYITQRMGVEDDSPNYYHLMSHALEPPGYEPQISPDEAAAACGLTADEYNRQVERLHAIKRASPDSYPDR